MSKDRKQWLREYDEAVQWRDWQSCDYLIEEREQATWYRSRGSWFERLLWWVATRAEIAAFALTNKRRYGRKA